MSQRAAAPDAAPLAIVLSGGGARGAYQVGVLRHILQRLPDLPIPIFTGVSSGAINAAFLAGRTGDLGEALEALCDHWCSLTTARVMRSNAAPMLLNALRIGIRLASGGSRLAPTVHGMVDTDPLRQFLAPLLDPDAVDENVRSGRLRALAISATSYRTGRIVTFVQADPEISMWERVRRKSVPARIDVDHVMASAAIPLFFPARQVKGEYFGDGGIRESYPLAPAVHLGARRILAVSSRSRLTSEAAPGSVVDEYPPAARVIGLLLNSIFLDNLDVDAERLLRINHLVSRVTPSRRWLLAEREVRLLVLRPSADISRLAEAHEAHLPRTVRFLVRGLGSANVSHSDLLSYILFEPQYLSHLIRLGEDDARRQWGRIRRFLDLES